MASPQLTSRPRTIKKLEKPRPLKLIQRHPTIDGRVTTVEDLVSLVDNVAANLSNGFYDPTLQQNIITMCNTLKHCAHQFEAVYKDQLDRAFVAIRNGSQDERLDLITRIHLLELIELRAKQWRHNDSMDVYYTTKLADLDTESDVHMLESLGTPLIGLNSPQTPPVLGIGDVLKNSGKFSKPTRIPGKNYCKDEVVIRNSDSGKVMGIKGRRVHMIEELSETIISFQRVNPGAKERLVQITGISEDKIHYAKDLIKETIQRNASPVRGVEKSATGGSSSSLNSSASDESNRIYYHHHQQQLQQQQQQQQQQHHHHHHHPSHLRSALLHSLSTNDASLGEYKHTVTVGNHALKITGTNLNLVRTAKLVLEEHFSKWSGDLDQFNNDTEYFSVFEEPSLESTTTSESEETFKQNKTAPIELTYEFLLLCAKGPYAKRAPVNWDRIQKECPNIVRKIPIRWFEPDTYKAKIVSSGMMAVLPFGEIDNEAE